MDKVKVFFVLGGPGVGKGTACARAVQALPKYVHLSAGQLLREMAADSVTELLNAGQIVPSHVTIKLLRKRMVERGWSVSTRQHRVFLIDGFPRNLENYSGWHELMPDSYVQGCLYLKARVDVMLHRVLHRKEGRSDDTEEGVRKRISTFYAETQPVLQAFEKENLLQELDAEKSPDEVYEQMLRLLTAGSR